jgi:zinc protease
VSNPRFGSIESPCSTAFSSFRCCLYFSFFPTEIGGKLPGMNARFVGSAFVLLFSVVGCVNLPRAGGPALKDIRFPLREIRAPNGMRIVIEEDHSSSMVGIYTVIGAGSSSDPKGKEGLAHILEHLTFRTKHDNKISLGKRQELSGVSFVNAETWFDYTMYYSVGKKDFLTDLLTLEAARLAAPVVGLDDTVLDVEREIVRNELRERGETSLGPSLPHMLTTVFPSEHPYSRSVGGTHESLDAITIDDVEAFTKEHYRTDNVTMLIIGDVDSTKIDSIIEASFPRALYVVPTKPLNWSSRLPAQAPVVPENKNSSLVSAVGSVATPELYLMWSLPRGFGDDSALQEFLQFRLSSEISDARNSDSDIASIDTFRIEGTLASFLVVRVALHKGLHPDESRGKILDRLVNMWISNNGLSRESEDQINRFVFSRIRGQALVTNLVNAENIAARGHERVLATHFSGDALMLSRRLRSLGQVTEGQVSSFAAEYLNRNRARTLLVRPASNASIKNEHQRAAYVEELAAKIVYPDEAIGALHAASITGLQSKILENGLTVQVLPRNGLPLVHMVLSIPQVLGSVQEQGAATLGSALMSSRGHRYGNASDYGILTDGQLSNASYSMTFSGASGNLPNMLAILSEKLDSLKLESGLLDEWKKESAPYFKALESLPQEQERIRRNAALYPGHALGMEASVDDLLKLKDSDLEHWISQLGPTGAVLTIVGDVDSAQATTLADRWLSGWRASQPVAAKQLDSASMGKRTLLVTHRSGASQTNVNVSCRTVGNTAKDRVLNEVLIDSVSARLHDRLREQLGATYGIRGRAISNLKGTSALVLSGALENESLANALKEISLAYAETSLNENDFNSARWRVGRQMAFERSSSRALALDLNEFTGMNFTPEEFDSWGQALETMRAKDAEISWKQCQQTLVISLLGDESVITPAIKSAGIESAQSK